MEMHVRRKLHCEYVYLVLAVIIHVSLVDQCINNHLLLLILMQCTTNVMQVMQ